MPVVIENPTVPPVGGAPWATPAGARKLWPDAQNIDDLTLLEILTAAQFQAETFAAPRILVEPPSPAIAAVREMAVTLEARELWAAYRRDGDVIGFDTYAIRVRPLSGTVAHLLRPAHGRPLAG